MYSAYKLNKQSDNIQPWRTPFPIWNQSVVPCPVLTVASWPAYRFLRRQVRWSGIPISLRIFQFVVIHPVKGLGIVHKAEVDVFLELSCFFDDPRMLAVWSLLPLPFLNPACTSGTSRFMYCLKPSVKYFEHYLASMWNERSCTVVWTLFGIALFWDWNESWTFSSSVAIAEFSRFAGILSAIL